MNYLLKQPTQKKARQSEPIPGREKDMVKNFAGGYVFQADSFSQLERFLILGSSGNTYYTSEQDLTKVNVDNVRACIEKDGYRVVQTIVDISRSGRAPKNDPALYALALCASYGGDEKVRAAALAALPVVARIGTHLFNFCAYIDTMRGWGPALRKAVAAWYTEKPQDKLAYQVLKYGQRGGWSHKDLLRLSHPTGQNTALFRYIIGADTESRDVRRSKSGDYKKYRFIPDKKLPDIIQGFEKIKGPGRSKHAAAALIREFGLTREMVPTEFQKDPEVWEALLEKMPMNAMIRTLGRMGACGLLAPFSNAAKEIDRRLNDKDLLHKSMVHPIQVLTALMTYKSGHGVKGSLSWPVVPQVVDGLEAAFYGAFDNVRPTNKRFFLGVDVSGSMTVGSVCGVPGLTPNMGAAAMAMLVARTEPNYFIGGFSTYFVDLGITAKDSLTSAMRKSQRDFGGTDTSTAIMYARRNNIPVDCFVILTDGMTWAGDVHTCQALKEFRNKMGIDTKLVVINMLSYPTTITDPTDSGSLDVVGFDSSVPTIIRSFVGVDDVGFEKED